MSFGRDKNAISHFSCNTSENLDILLQFVKITLHLLGDNHNYN